MTYRAGPAVLVAACLLFGCMPKPQETQPEKPVLPPPGMQLQAKSFSSLDGWSGADPRAGLAAFRGSCAAHANSTTGLYAATAEDWRSVCADVPADATPAAARAFFESRFVPYRVLDGGAETGLFTGYYEPEIEASRTKHGAYQTPLYAFPSDLISVDLGLFRDALKGQRLAGRIEGTKLVPYATRAEIDDKGLSHSKPLFFARDPVDAFVLEIQGSGRVKLDDGSTVRAVYAGANGQPYTAIGAVLIEQGELTREQVTMPAIRAWIVAHPDRGKALMETNASYVFFKEAALDNPALGAEGSGGVPLTPQASLAVYRSIHINNCVVI